ncbi:ISAs1 family transposase [Streptomyces lunaelactis]|uniref:ISAs1 family transposase n=1 Tax=Streptomyces lunaelactis TaxID=1535768 RepID=UPI003D6C7D8A
MPDPRRVRGRRYRIGSLLALCLVAVLCGAKSVTAIARFAVDSSPELRECLRFTSTTPNTTTLGRLLARLDGDAMDDAVGAWLGSYATDPSTNPARPCTDSRSTAKPCAAHAPTPARPSTCSPPTLHTSQTVISQHQIRAKSNEIPAFAPLVERIDLRGVVVTADALHTQRAHADRIIATDGHYLLVVKGNQKMLRKQLKKLPWREIPLQNRTTATGHSRREVRRLKVCTVQPGLLFPHAVQAIEIKRRRTNRKTGKVQTNGDEQALDLVAGQRDQVVRCGLVCVFVGADDCEEGMGQHREGDPAGPGGVAADLVLVQPGQPLLALEGLLHPPSGTCDLDQRGQGCRRGGVTAVVGKFTGGAVAADQ